MLGKNLQCDVENVPDISDELELIVNEMISYLCKSQQGIFE